MQMANIPMVLTASSAVIKRVFSGYSNGAVSAAGGASIRPVDGKISSPYLKRRMRNFATAPPHHTAND